MPFELQPKQYQSMFTPADMGVVQQGLAQRQGKYDAASSSWAQTKAALYEEPTYDPQLKEEVIKSIEGNFENVYKTYNGDLGAATSDLMSMIGSSRKNPYFRLNKVALEKKKEYDAYKQQYGAQALEFKQLPKGLRQGDKWRDQSEFDYDLVKDLDRDKKLADIIEQSLENVSNEGGLYANNNYPGILSRKTVFGKGLKQGKKAGDIYDEYLGTAEGQLHLRMLKELPGYKVDDPVNTLKDYVNKAVNSRMAPPSTSYQDIHDPNYGRGSGGSQETSSPITHVVTGASAEAVNSPEIVKNLQSKPIHSIIFPAHTGLYGKPKTDDATMEVARAAVSNAAKTPQAKLLMSQIKAVADRLGVNVSDFTQDGVFSSNGLIVNSGLGLADDYHSIGGYKNKEGKTVPLNGVKVKLGTNEISDPRKSAELRILNEYMVKYNNLIDGQTKSNLDLTPGDDPYSRWYAIDVQGVNSPVPLTEAEKTARRNLVKDAGSYLMSNVSKGHLDFLNGPYAGKHSEELSKNKDFKDLKMEVMSYKPTDDGVKVMLLDDKGDEHTVLINNADVGTTFSSMMDDKLAEGLAAYTQYKPIYGSNKIEINKQPVTLQNDYSINKDISVDGQEYVTVSQKGNAVTVGDLIQGYDEYLSKVQNAEEKAAITAERDSFIQQQRSRHGEQSVEDKPVYLYTKVELIPFLKTNKALK